MEKTSHEIAANVAIGHLCELAEEQQANDDHEMADRLWEIAHGLELARYAPNA